MHFDEKSSSGRLWGRRAVGRVGGRGAGASSPIHSPSPHSPSPAQATTAVEPTAGGVCGVSGMRPSDSPAIINLDEFSAEYTSRAFKPLTNCN